MATQLTKQQRDLQRYRRRGTTAQRGLGYTEHVRPGKALLAAWKPGDLCARCGQPMWQRWTTTRSGKRVSAIDVDDFPGRVYGGPQVKRLSHRACNRRAGQQMTTAILRARNAQWRSARQW